MQFLFFIFTVWAAGWFYRWEHRLFLREMEAFRGQVDLSFVLPDGLDWRSVKRAGDKVYLRRAFNIRDREDALRYGAPVLIFLALLFLVQSWFLSFAYLAAVLAKWFVGNVVFDTAARRYEVTLGDYRLFGGSLD